jgi:hypothetical protein
MITPTTEHIMKRILILAIACISVRTASAQADFNKRLGEAKAAYAANKLDDARFAMQQMIQELDILTGKDVLKLLPATMDGKAANAAKDNVSGASGYVGVVVHREYGTATDGTNPQLEVITNSPMIGMLNSLLSIPLIGNNQDRKIIKVAGYKGLVEKTSGANGKEDYEVQIPITNSLITLKAPGLSQDKVIELANTIPVAEIAKLVQ